MQNTTSDVTKRKETEPKAFNQANGSASFFIFILPIDFRRGSIGISVISHALSDNIRINNDECYFGSGIFFHFYLSFFNLKHHLRIQRRLCIHQPPCSNYKAQEEACSTPHPRRKAPWLRVRTPPDRKSLSIHPR